jgi:nitroreductase
MRIVDLFEAIRKRRSVRAFTPQAVEAEKLAQVLAAANAAPSAGNLQGYEIFQITRKETRIALARAALDQLFIAQAPVALVFCANPARSAAKYRKRGESLYAIQDATIACAFAMLAATALGLGTVWVGAFNDAAVERVLGVRDLSPVAILPIGYPAEEPAPTPRRSLDDLVHR